MKNGKYMKNVEMDVKTMRANKKSQMLKTFVQIVFFLMLFVIAHKAYSSIMGFWIKDLEQGTIKSMEGLRIEIDNMVGDEVSVPIYIDARHKINGFKNSLNPRFCKDGKSCICICSKDSNCENNAIKRCMTINNAKLAEDFSCLPRSRIQDKKLQNRSKTGVFNAILTKENGKVKVNC